MKKLVVPMALMLMVSACGSDDDEASSDVTTAGTAGAVTTVAGGDTTAAAAAAATTAAGADTTTAGADTTAAGADTTAAGADTTAAAGADTTAAGTGGTTAGTTAGTTGATSAGSTPGSAVGAECGPDSDVWHEAGMLTVATGEPAFPPYVIDDAPESGEGFEAAVVYEVADRLGFAADQVTWVRTTFDEAISPGDKPYDFNVQQYGITEERDQVVDFSIPYYNDQKVVVALQDSDAAGATTFADLEGLRWGATIGTTDYDYIVNEIGIAEDDVQVYNDQAATFAAFDANQIDATVIGLPTALYVTGVERPDTTIVGLLPRTEADADGMGLLFADGNPARDCVDTALQAMTDDGTLDALDTEWMQSGGEIPEITQ